MTRPAESRVGGTSGPATGRLDRWSPTTESGLQACYGKSPGSGALSIGAEPSGKSAPTIAARRRRSFGTAFARLRTTSDVTSCRTLIFTRSCDRDTDRPDYVQHGAGPDACPDAEDFGVVWVLHGTDARSAVAAAVLLVREWSFQTPDFDLLPLRQRPPALHVDIGEMGEDAAWRFGCVQNAPTLPVAPPSDKSACHERIVRRRRLRRRRPGTPRATGPGATLGQVVATQASGVVAGLTRPEITRIVNRYIGLSAGFLGDFTYGSHSDFYLEYCDLDLNPFDYLPHGTTRERFIRVLEETPPHVQAKIIRGVVEKYRRGASRRRAATQHARSRRRPNSSRLRTAWSAARWWPRPHRR